jgi:uncharacterized protein HemX
MTRTTKLTGLVLAGVVALGTSMLSAQVKQDMKNAGHDTADATKTAAHDTAHGTKKVAHHTVHRTKIIAHATKRDTEKGAEKTATGTRNVGRRIEGKPTVPNNPDPR